MKKALVIVVALLVGLVLVSGGFAQEATGPSPSQPEQTSVEGKTTVKQKVKKTAKKVKRKVKKAAKKTKNYIHEKTE
jgi:hypothetical protein